MPDSPNYTPGGTGIRNPFARGTKSHQIWDDTERWAKEHLALFASAYIEKLPVEAASQAEYIDYFAGWAAGVFDVWAGAFSKDAVLTDEAAATFDDLCEELQIGLTAQMSAGAPKFIAGPLYLSGIRRRLAARKLHWTGNMLRAVRKRKEARSSSTPQNLGENAKVPQEVKRAPVPPAGETSTNRMNTGAPDPIRSGETSSRFRARYARGVAELLEQLNERWTTILPEEATLPLGTCEDFFTPFVNLGVAMYDAHAEETLDRGLSDGAYLDFLNFELKSRICDQIARWCDHPIRTLQEALEADKLGQVSDEWTLRMSASWRQFDHPRHSTLDSRVRRNIIEGLLDEPEHFERLLDRVHKAISRRTGHWIASHAENAQQVAESGPVNSSEDEGGSTTRTTGSAHRVMSDPCFAHWREIEIVFTSDNRVCILGNGTRMHYDYIEFGFEDKRCGKPNEAWVAMRFLAQHGGVVSSSRSGAAGWSIVEKRMQEVRRLLRQRFPNLVGDPIPFVKGTGYQTEFKVGLHPDFHH